MSTLTTLRTATEAQIEALTGQESLRTLTTLKAQAAAVGLPTTAIDVRINALAATSPAAQLENARALALGQQISGHSGQLVQTLATSINGLPLLPADRAMIDAQAHPRLAQLLPTTYCPIAEQVARTTSLAVMQGQPAASADQTKLVTAWQSGTTAYARAYVNGVASTTFSQTEATVLGMPQISADGSVGGALMYYTVSGQTRLAMLSGGGITSSTVTAASNASSKALAVAGDGSAVYVFERDASNDLAMYQSVNGGGTWSGPTVFAAGGAIGAVYAACADADGSHLYVMDNGSRIWASVNGGGTFATVATLPVSAGVLSELRCDTTGQYIIARITTNELYLSRDYGTTWARVTIDAPVNTINAKAVAFGVRSDNTLVVVFTGSDIHIGQIVLHIATSTDWAVTWAVGPAVLAADYPAVTAQSPLAVHADGLTLLSNNNSATPSVISVALSAGKHLPWIPGTKVVGG